MSDVPSRTSSRGSWFYPLLGAGIIALALFRWSLWAGGAGVALAAAYFVAARVAAKRRRARGYWVEYLSPAQVRGEANTFCVVYHEGDQNLWFSGQELPRPARWKLHVPAAENWEDATGEWARERREEILQRVRADSIVARRCELVDISAP